MPKASGIFSTADQKWPLGNLNEVSGGQSASVDPLGTMILIEYPCPEVSRALVGPLPTENQAAETVWCLAAHGETFAARVEVNVAQLQSDSNTFWKTVIPELERTKNQPLITLNASARLSPPDCVKVLSSMESWCPRPNQWTLHPVVRVVAQAISIERFGTLENLSFEDKLSADLQAQANIESSFKSGVLWVLNAIKPELLNALIQRPRMSILMAHKIYSSAAEHSQQAATYALQAIVTESQGVLDLLARGQPEREAHLVRDALFTGKSLPSTFTELGITKSAHRSSLRKPPVFLSLDRVPDPQRSLNDLPLNGREFLTTMRLQTHMPLQGRQDWVDFTRLIEKLVQLELQDPEATTEKLFLWCLDGRKYAGSADRLERMIKRASTLVCVTRNLAQHVITIDTAISVIIEALSENDSGFGLTDSERGLGHLLRLISKISGKSVDALTRQISATHPGIPRRFTPHGNIQLVVLDAINVVLDHGEVSKNCLSVLAGIMQYLTKGLALYAARAGYEIVGTIALGFNGLDAKRQVRVHEVRGSSNATASTQLTGVAEDLARSFLTKEDRHRWVIYEKKCKEWCRLAGHDFT